MAAKAGATKVDKLKNAAPIALEEWFDLVRESADATNEEKGACLLHDSVTGQPYCTRTTPSACKKLKGEWIGGPCGG